MLNLELNKTILLIHLSEGDEAPPGWAKRDGLVSCEHKNKTIKFYSFDKIACDDVEREWQEILHEARDESGISFDEKFLIVLAHNLRKGCLGLANLIENDEHVQWHYDYGSSDIGYEDFWRDLRASETCCQLVERLQEWVRKFWNNVYIADPLGRIKHRAFDQLAPVAKDIEQIKELYDRQRFLELKDYLQELQTEWQGEFPGSRSLKSYLARIWFLIFGNAFQWSQLGIAPPQDIALIPAEGGGRLSLLDIMNQYAGQHFLQGKEWQQLLQLLQISAGNDGTCFISPGGGVYRFACALDECVLHFDEIRKFEKITGFEDNRIFGLELAKFLEWYASLNDILDAMRGKWQKTFLSSATNDSTASSEL